MKTTKLLEHNRKSKNSEYSMTRRGFLKKTAVIGAGTLAGGLLLADRWPFVSTGRAADIVYTAPSLPVPYPIVDTGQVTCYGDHAPLRACPSPGGDYYGQDAQYLGFAPSYRDNNDGTITDLVTGLMWQKTPGEKISWQDAMDGAGSLSLAGYSDWRMPTIKELYSLMLFSGYSGRTISESKPYLDTDYFDFEYGDTSKFERIIDCQYWSATKYTGVTMGGNVTAFGVNFADGRIKGYGIEDPRREYVHTLFVRYVRGNPDYGVNDFVDNNDDTITDRATGLMWTKADSGILEAKKNGALNWEEALEWAEGLTAAGFSDWRLPDAKELQSIVDYTRSPQATGSPAIDPVFSTSAITDEGDGVNYPCYWTGTSHVEGPGAEKAVYVAFGEALGYFARPPGTSTATLMDVHGAGAQRSDPKSGDPSQFEGGRGPQGDVIRIYNYARAVRTAGD